MKKLKLTAILLISSLLMSGCYTPKRINRIKARWCNDYTQTIIKDSLIKIPIYYTDSAYMQLWLFCDSANQVQISKEVTMQGKISALEQRLTDNKIFIHSKTIVRDTVLKTVTNTITKQGTTVYKKMPLSGYENFCIWGFWIELIILLIWFIWRMLRKKIKSYLAFMDVIR